MGIYLQRILRPFAQIREDEIFTTILMFAYSFLAMSAYNIIQPVQRSLFIEKLGANKVPYVQLAAGFAIGLIMSGYAWLMSRLPRRWALPIMQVGIAVVLLGFWVLFRTQPDQKWVAVGLYLLGFILAILLISQFWTLANVVYDPRQAKRLFGFIGGGATLGGTLGAVVTWFAARIGTVDLLLISSGLMLACAAVVVVILRREHVGEEIDLGAVQKEGVGARRALELLRASKHLRLIALVISFGAIGSVILDNQLNLATEAFKGREGADAMTAFFGQIRASMSMIALAIQLGLTSRIQRYLGVGFALLMLPVGLGTTALIILFNAALWAPSLARVLDQSLRYTVDKTTREILYMPLPGEIKYEAKPFVDVTCDRFAKGVMAVLLLILISPWGLNLGWQKLSFVSLTLTVIWFFVAQRARRGYQAAFRQSLQAREIKPAEVRLAVADLSTIESLIQELASADASRVLYAIDMLESLDKRNLITPLLLYHESPAVRARALGLVAATLPSDAARWLPAIQRMMADESPQVRAAAVGALSELRDENVNDLVRPYLHDTNTRIAMTAAMVLACSNLEEDVAAAEGALRNLVSDTRDSAAPTRREFAIALRYVTTPRFRRLLIPLLNDTNSEVVEEAMRTVRQLGIADFIFVPTLISLLRNRRLKSDCRRLLVGYGEPILNILGHFLREPEEDIRVRHQVPAVIARIGGQRAMDILVGGLAEQDGALRFKVLAAIETLHRADPHIYMNRETIEALLLKEEPHISYCRALSRELSRFEQSPKDSLLARALAEKTARAEDRIWRFLGLIYPWRDIAATQWTIKHGDARARSAALEYLDSALARPLRKRLMPLFEGPTSGQQAGRTNALSEGVAATLENTVLRLLQDSDPVVAATAILFAGQAKLGSLQERLEEVLPTRESGNWLVFEAATWVAATFRLQEERRHLLWVEPIPTVEAADRLRRLPLFASVTVDGLFRIVGAGNQVRHERGKVLSQEGSLPSHVHLLLDGCVSCRTSTGDVRELEAPAALGLPEMLEGKPFVETVRTASPVACLTLSSEECRSVLADDTELVQGLFRMLCGAAAADLEKVVIRGNRGRERTIIPGQGLKPIEKALILKSIPVFSGVSPEEMHCLVGIAEEVDFETGSVLFGESDEPAIHALAAGEISLESFSGAPALVAEPNDVVGVSHTLAGLSLGLNARVVRDGRALRIRREDLFDLASLRPELLQQLFSAVLGARTTASASV